MSAVSGLAAMQASELPVRHVGRAVRSKSCLKLLIFCRATDRRRRAATTSSSWPPRASHSVARYAFSLRAGQARQAAPALRTVWRRGRSKRGTSAEQKKSASAIDSRRLKFLVRPARFELTAFCSGGKRSIQLSYGRTLSTLLKNSLLLCQLARAKD